MAVYKGVAKDTGCYVTVSVVAGSLSGCLVLEVCVWRILFFVAFVFLIVPSFGKAGVCSTLSLAELSCRWENSAY